MECIFFYISHCYNLIKYKISTGAGATEQWVRYLRGQHLLCSTSAPAPCWDTWQGRRWCPKCKKMHSIHVGDRMVPGFQPGVVPDMVSICGVHEQVEGDFPVCLSRDLCRSAFQINKCFLKSKEMRESSIIWLKSYPVKLNLATSRIFSPVWETIYFHPTVFIVSFLWTLNYLI